MFLFLHLDDISASLQNCFTWCVCVCVDCERETKLRNSFYMKQIHVLNPKLLLIKLFKTNSWFFKLHKL